MKRPNGAKAAPYASITKGSYFLLLSSICALLSMFSATTALLLPLRCSTSVLLRCDLNQSSFPHLSSRLKAVSAKDDYRHNGNDDDRKRKQRRLSPNKKSVDSSFSAQSSQEDGVQQTTLSGGPSLIFAMARRMLVWDDASYRGLNDASAPPDRKVLPRWHPHSGISDAFNPTFRVSAPVMNNRGYANTIWRNCRKKNKPSLWRYSLRLFEKMKRLESKGSGGVRIRRGREHFEGALAACAKLGLWREAFSIFDEILESNSRSNENEHAIDTDFEQENGQVDINNCAPMLNSPTTVENKLKNTKQADDMRKSTGVEVTETMISSLISACVRGANDTRKKKKGSADTKECRMPLDMIRDILLNMEERHGITLVSRHVNSLAAAYQSCGYNMDAARLIHTTLVNRTISISSKNFRDDSNSNRVYDKKNRKGHETFTFDDNSSRANKDKASYNILVTGAVENGDWSSAIEALREMTEAGLYPNSRSLNTWNEAAERTNASGVGGGVGGRIGRKRSSWKKQRDEYWLDNLKLYPPTATSSGGVTVTNNAAVGMSDVGEVDVA